MRSKGHVTLTAPLVFLNAKRVILNIDLKFFKDISPSFLGSGDVDDVGTGRGKGYTVNIPLKDGAGDATLYKVISTTLDKVITR